MTAYVNDMPEVSCNPEDDYDFGISNLADEIDRELQAHGIELDLN